VIFAHGTLLPDSELSEVLKNLPGELDDLRQQESLDPELAISALDSLGGRLDRGELDALIAQFAPPGALEALAQVRPMLTQENLEARLDLELGPDFRSPQPRPFGHSISLPLGTLFHVAAGNVDGLPVFSAVEGLLTGNVNLLKLPREDKGLSFAVLQALTDQEPKLASWLYAFDTPSSDHATLKALADLADGLVVWGGDEAVAACRALAPPGCKLMEWGHRLSFAYLSRWVGLDADLAALADHIVETGGLLCSSCQVIFLDAEDRAEGENFCRTFLPVLEEAAARRYRTPGQAAQATLYGYEHYLEGLTHPDRGSDIVFRGRACSLTLSNDQELTLSPLHGNVLVKRLPHKDLLPALRRQKGRLQTAGLVCPAEERVELTNLLARAGVNRITRPGHMSSTFPGEAHDGEYPLRRYRRTVDIEK